MTNTNKSKQSCPDDDQDEMIAMIAARTALIETLDKLCSQHDPGHLTYPVGEYFAKLLSKETTYDWTTCLDVLFADLEEYMQIDFRDVRNRLEEHYRQ
jgi:hypothetical protein